MKRKSRLLEATKKVSTSPFKPSSVTPMPSGKGSLFGTIEQQWPTMSNELDMSKFPEKKIADQAEKKANFVTKPPKMGGYGYIKAYLIILDLQMLVLERHSSIRLNRMIENVNRRSSMKPKPKRRSSASSLSCRVCLL
jgi:hypothetical protein